MNRKQRRALEVAVKKMKKVKEQVQVMDVNEKMQALVDGKEASDDPVVNYLVKAVNEAAGERNSVSQQLQQAQQAVANMQNRLVQLNGIFQKSLADLRQTLESQKKASADNGSREQSDEAA